MLKFRLHLNECGDRTDAEEITEAETLEAVRVIAIQAALGIMAEEVRGGRVCLSCSIEIADAQGALVACVPFQEALKVTGFKPDF